MLVAQLVLLQAAPSAAESRLAVLQVALRPVAMQVCAAELWAELPASLREGLVRDGLDEPDIFVNLFVDGELCGR